MDMNTGNQLTTYPEEATERLRKICKAQSFKLEALRARMGAMEMAILQVNELKERNTNLFGRIGDLKKKRKGDNLEITTLKEQVAALSAHIEKLMTMLRAECAAKLNSQEESQMLQQQLREEQSRRSALTAQHNVAEQSWRGLQHQDKMLKKQLEANADKNN